MRRKRTTIDHREIPAGATSVAGHNERAEAFTKEYTQAVKDGFEPILPDGTIMSTPVNGVPVYNAGAYATGFGDVIDSKDPVNARASMEASWCGDGRRDGILMGSSATMLDYNQLNFNAVEGGTENLGYAVWGPGNMLPNAIYKAGASMPWVASALDYIDRTTFGLGARVTYTVSRYSGGTVTHEDMDYQDAEIYLKERVIALLSKLDTLTAGDESSTVPTVGGKSIPMVDIATGQKAEKKSYHDKLVEHVEKQLYDANAELEAYYKGRAYIDSLLEHNNIQFFLKRWIADNSRFGICFPMIGLSRNNDSSSQWSPKIVSLEMRDASVMRLEQRDPDNGLRINYVYNSEMWREGGALQPGVTNSVIAFPCINPEHPLDDLDSLVRKNKRTRVGDRPYWLCYPCFQPTPTKNYYPQLPWWSIFPSQVYQYASTMIYDKATARKNSTMWGKILFINTAYLAQIFAQAGEKGKTPEGQKAIRKGIYDSVENFLKRRDNNGKLLVMDSYPSADEKQMIDSVRIVDVPNSTDAKASASEVAELISLVSYSLGVNMALVGSAPTTSSASTGTAQRELHLLKNGQLSPDRVTFTDFFDNFVFRYAGISERFRMKLFYPTLTTLDNSKTGTVEQYD